MAELLRQRIFSRELEPGSWIDELKLAEEYGISRTPLREALKVLAAEGLVTMKVRRGAYVTEMSDDDLAEVYHLLALLESDAAGVVARTRQRGRARGTAGAARASSRSGRADRETLLRHQRALPHAPAGDRRQPLAHQMVADLRKVMKLNRHHSLAKRGRLEDSLAEHRQIMQALERHDAKAATALMRGHFENGLEAASG